MSLSCQLYRKETTLVNVFSIFLIVIELTTPNLIRVITVRPCRALLSKLNYNRYLDINTCSQDQSQELKGSFKCCFVNRCHFIKQIFQPFCKRKPHVCSQPACRRFLFPFQAKKQHTFARRLVCFELLKKIVKWPFCQLPLSGLLHQHGGMYLLTDDFLSFSYCCIQFCCLTISHLLHRTAHVTQQVDIP